MRVCECDVCYYRVREASMSGIEEVSLLVTVTSPELITPQMYVVQLSCEF